MRTEIATIEIRREPDVVHARQSTRLAAEALGFDTQEQTRVATAVSELARNAFQYAGGGRLELALDAGADGRFLVARVSDEGPGIPHLRRVLDGDYRSSTGMGLGLVGARRLCDRFDIESEAGRGTRVEVAKQLAPRAPRDADAVVAALRETLGRRGDGSMFGELQRQNQELLRLVDELRARQSDVERLNLELEETNRGVVALYAELDDRAEDLKRASEMKSRFLSNISHELRTPLTSVVNLARLLLDRTDGDLTSEQERQVTLISKAATGLMEMVNDLLDLAKIEAGKTTMRLTEVPVSELFSALRGMFRPVVQSDVVALVFEEPEREIVLSTDEAKLSQVLRNFIANAVKFTERGEIRVTARHDLATDLVTLAVRDTGVGIAPSDQGRVFEEFVQVDGPHQRRAKGTGLGLSLSRKIAELLGGVIGVESTVGEGSTFHVTIPRVHASAERGAADDAGGAR